MSLVDSILSNTDAVRDLAAQRSDQANRTGREKRERKAELDGMSSTPFVEFDLDVVAIRFLSVADQLHLWHWQHKGAPAHEALGNLYGFVREFADGFVEKAMANGPVPKALNLDHPRDFADMEDLQSYLMAQINFAINTKEKCSSRRPDLQNLLDEYVAEMFQYKYKFTLR